MKGSGAILQNLEARFSDENLTRDGPDNSPPPFKYYEHDPLTDINVAPHWHQGIELNYLVSGTTLKFVTDGQTNEYRPGDLWTTNRRVVHSASGPTEVDWVEFGIIIDDDFLQTQIPASANWQLTLNGAASSKTHPQAYADVRQQLVTIHDLLTTPRPIC